MKKRISFLLAALLILGLLSGCTPTATSSIQESAATQPLPQSPTAPADGDPKDVTCKGSYSSVTFNRELIARVGETNLTNGELQFYYLGAIGSYFQGNPTQKPDLTQDLDTQSCPIDKTVRSWQQYFLKEALSSWHTAQALVALSKAEGLPVEPEYAPSDGFYEEYMDGMPATKYMYRYTPDYAPNSMHQKYLDELPQVFEALAKELGFSSGEELAQTLCGVSLDTLVESANVYNWGYMYLSTMADYLKPEEADIQEAADKNKEKDAQVPYVDFHQVLLTPEEGETSEDCKQRAEKMVAKWSGFFRKSEGTFGQMAYDYSEDEASRLLGGAYLHVPKGGLIPELEDWLFDDARVSGDATVVESPLGIHMLYYTAGNTLAYAQAEQSLLAENLQKLAQRARETYPMTVYYGAIRLMPIASDRLFSFSDVLYQDVAHERFPEIPLYLQQDYGATRYGNYPLRTYGCGITSLSMLSTYMTDTELTPPEMCRRYGSYCHSDGTDGMIFINEPCNMGYYVIDKIFSGEEALKALKDGYVVVSLQNYGYWTSKGHYIVLEKIDEDGIQVRDSNIYNYRKLPAHKLDRHSWNNIFPNNVRWWVFEKKQVRSPLCTRCGTPESYPEGILKTDYLCQRCAKALTRRNLYLSLATTLP